MGKLWEALTGPVSGLIHEVGGILDNLTTTDAEKLEAQRKLIELERSFQTKLVELDGQFAQAQASVIQEEIKGQSWMQRNWRPSLMYLFMIVIAWNYLIVPIFGMTATPLVPDMWELLKIGMGGYIFGRSAEKIVPAVADAIRSKNEK